MAATEIEDFLNADTVERAYRIANQCSRAKDTERAMYGLRVARDRHPKIRRVLEAMAEQTDKTADAQFGRTRRGVSATHAEKALPTEAGLCREAHLAVEQDNQAVMAHFMFIYYGAACVAGLVTGPYG